MTIIDKKNFKNLKNYKNSFIQPHAFNEKNIINK